MTEQVGLKGTLDLTQFNSSFQRYTRSLDQMNRQTKNTATSMNNSFIGLGESVNRLATRIGVGLVAALGAAGVALGAFLKSSISDAADFEQQLDVINSILGSTAQESSLVRQEIIDLGLDPRLKVSAQEAAMSVELLARNGLEVNEIISQTGDVMDGAAGAAIVLANATGADFGLAANIATDALAIFNLEASDMQDAVSSITGVVNNSKFTIQDYNLALRNGAPAAAIAGVTLEEYNTAIAAMAEELGSGMKAGTGFRTFLTRLTPDTERATDAMKDLGFITADGKNIFFDANGELKDMAEVTRILNQALFGTNQVMTEVGGRTSEQNRVLGELRSQYQQAQQNVLDYQSGVKGILLTDDERNAQIAQQEELMGLLSPRISELEGVQGELITTTSKLTDEQRLNALESVFMMEGMNAAIGLAKEGEPAFKTVAEGMSKFNLTQGEATRLLEEGATAWDILYTEISRVDAVAQAEQRMENLKGSLEILKGGFEALKIQIGEKFLPLLTELADEAMVNLEAVSRRIIDAFGLLADSVSFLRDELLSGNDIVLAFTKLLLKLGLDDAAKDFKKAAKAIENFVTPIAEFIKKHADKFEGALVGIGGALAGAGIAVKLRNIGLAILAINPFVAAFIAIMAGLGVAVKTDLLGMGTAFENVVTSIKDGSFTLAGAGQEIQNVFMNLWSFVEPSLTTFTTSIITWFQEQDWGALAIQASQAIIEGYGILGEGIGEVLGNFLITITDWINNTDWEQFGADIVTFIANGFETFVQIAPTIFLGFYNFIKSFLDSQDWLTIGMNLITAIFSAFEGIENVIKPKLTSIWETFTTWVTETNWIQLGVDIITFIIEGLGQFVTFVIEKQTEWYNSFVTWVQETDWLQLGIDITTFILDGLFEFVTLVVDTLALWLEQFTTWVKETDWEQVGVDIAHFIVAGIQILQPLVTALAEWRQAFLDWVDENDGDWEQMGKDIVETILEGLGEFADKVWLTLKTWFTAVADWVSQQDWKGLGTAIVDGIKQGIIDAGQSIKDAMGGILDGMLNGAKQQEQIQSPSKLWASEVGTPIIEGIFEGMKNAESIILDFIPDMTNRMKAATDPISVGETIGNQLVEGLRNSLTSGMELLGGLLDLGGTIAGVGSSFVSIFEDRTIKPLEDEVKSLDDVLKEAGKTEIGKEALEIKENLGIDDLDKFLQLATAFPSVLLNAGSRDAVDELHEILLLEQQRAEKVKDVANAEEEILRIQKQQQDLQLLQAQFDLLQLIDENQLDGSQLLQGLTLGLEASLPELLQVTSDAMQQIIEAAQQELQIASPSKVFEDIGKQVMQGFMIGNNELSPVAQSNMADITKGIIDSAIGVVRNNNTTNNNQRQTTNSFEINNSFAEQSSVTVNSELELLLASFN